ncbi:class I SAM-dependent methyltransferase [Actinacidiphila acididurans]|uniref:Class I SAM-dependent methyltransferase n=1 Tax=Actinacidiphila acididurans TaxID=2784346 RepID=A0ABS2TK70_9ACTN|nr:class I SAM-dependent methyltransferase [Actinacidiphila acididurans]MBM9503227.1 class I SAM-dependent methyltransferase [Actinacidiphila acididurans]
MTYPRELIDDLVGLQPATVLDVGCGTGKAAVALLGRGLSVLGVELDERMAQVARGHGVDVQVSAFESWDSAGRTFDLVTCGDAWHWIDPVRGVAKAAEVLDTGGTIARFWTSTVLDEEFSVAFDPIYRSYAPEVVQVWRSAQGKPRVHASRADLFERSAAFSPVGMRSYRWERSFGGDEWVGLAGTVSDHQRLGTERLTALLRALRLRIDELGGTVHSRQETYVLLAQRVQQEGFEQCSRPRRVRPGSPACCERTPFVAPARAGARLERGDLVERPENLAA